MGIAGWLIGAMVVILATSAQAQTGWFKFQPTGGITLESHKGSFNDMKELSFLTSVWYLSGEFKASRDLYFVAEIPFSHFGVKSEYDFPAQNAVGNPYFGLRYERQGTSGIFRLGARFPIVSDEKNFIYATRFGQMTTFDRFGAFVPGLFTLSAQGGYKYISPSGAGFRFMLGPTLFAPRDGERELWADFGTHVLFQSSQFTFGGGFAGRFLAAARGADNIDFSERFVNRLEFAWAVTLGQVRPGFHLQAPLDDDQKEDITLTYGLDLTIALK